ncbi:unnamed protein product [Peniophora sp. CBMAI 1063]|nr:unnamed protein product [Peniophora sp. CBMAI 1063]
MATQPKLPSRLPSQPAVRDATTTAEQLQQPLIGRATNPNETAIFICAYADCNRLYPNRERLMMHRRRDHQTEDGGQVVTWNE